MCIERHPSPLPPPLPWCCILTSGGPSTASTFAPPLLAPCLVKQAPPPLHLTSSASLRPPAGVSPASCTTVAAAASKAGVPSGEFPPEAIRGLALLLLLGLLPDRRLPMPIIFMSWLSRCGCHVLMTKIHTQKSRDKGEKKKKRQHTREVRGVSFFCMKCSRSGSFLRYVR